MLHSSISEKHKKDTFFYDWKSKLTEEANLNEYNSLSSHFLFFFFFVIIV